jgi:hypothetical protein
MKAIFDQDMSPETLKLLRKKCLFSCGPFPPPFLWAYKAHTFRYLKNPNENNDRKDGLKQFW